MTHRYSEGDATAKRTVDSMFKILQSSFSEPAADDSDLLHC